MKPRAYVITGSLVLCVICAALSVLAYIICPFRVAVWVGLMAAAAFFFVVFICAAPIDQDTQNRVYGHKQ